MQDFSQKVAVVTGAGRGIGEAIARRLVEGGARVALVSRNESSCGRVAKELNALRENSARYYALDVASGEAVEAMAKAAMEDFGQIDILVNNAGITRDGLLMRMKEENWDAVLDTNLKGAYHFIRHFQRALMKSEQGRIINISSVIGLTGNAGQVNYAASKAGLIGLTKSVARELAGRAVTCNAVAPGFIETEMTGELSEKIQESIRSQVPLGTFGQVEDVAAAVAFLASAEGRYITGQTLVVDGGMTM